MIAFLTHAEIDRARWDRCIQQAENPLVYAMSWYLDLAAPGWNALVLNDYEAVMPLPEVKKIVRVAYQPFFVQQLGVFSRPGITDPVPGFIRHIPSRFRYINLCLNETNRAAAQVFPLAELPNYVLGLQASYQEVQKGFSEHCRRNIRRARKAGLCLETSSPEEVIAYYTQHKGEATEHVKPAHYRVLRQIMEEAGRRDALKCVKVTNAAGRLLACAAFYVQPNRIIYQLGTADDGGREARALYFLFDEVIRMYCGTARVLDFEGSQLPGVARFFAGFGAAYTPYFRLVINRLPWPLNRLKK